MSRKPSHQRRRRPGHRPPNRYSGSGHHPAGPRPQGFTPSGWRQFFNVVLPHKGAGKRRFFNELGDGIALGAGLIGVIIGYAALGLIGAIVGLWVGVTLCGMALEEGRYIRR